MNPQLRDLRQKLQCDLRHCVEQLSATLIVEHLTDEGLVLLLSNYVKRAKDIIAQNNALKDPLNGHHSHRINPSDGFDDDGQHADARRELQQFTDDQRVIDFAHQHRLTFKHGETWVWCANQLRPNGTVNLGTIQGLPGILGVCRITNGVEVWIERLDGTLVLAHVEWFKGYRNASVVPKKVTREQKMTDMMKDRTPANAEALRSKLLELLS